MDKSGNTSTALLSQRIADSRVAVKPDANKKEMIRKRERKRIKMTRD